MAKKIVCVMKVWRCGKKPNGDPKVCASVKCKVVNVPAGGKGPKRARPTITIDGLSVSSQVRKGAARGNRS